MKRWLILMGPHRFVVKADDQAGAARELGARCEAVGLEVGPAEIIEYEHPESA